MVSGVVVLLPAAVMGEALRMIGPGGHNVVARLLTGPHLAPIVKGTPGLGLLEPLCAFLSSHHPIIIMSPRGNFKV